MLPQQQPLKAPLVMRLCSKTQENTVRNLCDRNSYLNKKYVVFLVTDRFSREGKAMGSVRPFPFYLLNRVERVFLCECGP